MSLQWSRNAAHPLPKLVHAACFSEPHMSALASLGAAYAQQPAAQPAFVLNASRVVGSLRKPFAQEIHVSLQGSRIRSAAGSTAGPCAKHVPQCSPPIAQA